MLKCRKRDGSIIEFDLSKITSRSTSLPRRLYKSTLYGAGWLKTNNIFMLLSYTLWKRNKMLTFLHEKSSRKLEWIF